MIRTIWCVQIFRRDKWETVYLATFGLDAREAYESTCELTYAPVRLVWFGVLGADFIATHARDFEVVDSRSELG